MKKSTRAEIAKDSLRIIEQRKYENGSKGVIEIGRLVDHAIEGTVAIAPDAPLRSVEGRSDSRARLEVTAQSTLQAIIELHAAGVPGLACLNFASAKNAGGGFLGGAQAQEESLARSSALYPCLISQPVYYETNRACRTTLYTDWMIWSPDVPFFRDDDGALLDHPALASVITAPAPNTGAVKKNEPEAAAQIQPTLERRAARVLEVAASYDVRTLILGAWGCGVFRNDPRMVAETFASLLCEDGPFANAFERVVFAICDSTREEEVLTAFRDALKKRV